jgi:hypothetical protein
MHTQRHLHSNTELIQIVIVVTTTLLTLFFTVILWSTISFSFTYVILILLFSRAFFAPHIPSNNHEHHIIDGKFKSTYVRTARARAGMGRQLCTGDVTARTS